MSVWATYVKRQADSPWQLEAMSVLSADRARGLAEREHARSRVVGAEYKVVQYPSIHAVPSTLDAAAAQAL